MKKYFKHSPPYNHVATIGIYIVVFLATIPSLKIIPLPGLFSYTHNFARFLIILISGLVFFNQITLRRKLFRYEGVRNLLIPTLIFLVSQTLSILRAQNISSFLNNYKDIFLSICFFYSYIHLEHKDSEELVSNTIRILFATGLINIFIALFLYFSPPLYDALLKPFLHETYIVFIDYQAGRDRYFSNIFFEFLIPLLFYQSLKKNSPSSFVFSSIYMGLISGLVILSNWRSKIVVLAFSFVASFIYMFYRKVNLKYIVLLTAILIMFFSVADTLSLRAVGFNTLDRLFAPSKEDVKTFNVRFSYWNESIDLFLSSPVTGIGLGNYYELSSALQDTESVGKIKIIENPHSIIFSTLADSGLLGIGALLLLLFVFAQDDYRSWKSGNTRTVYCTIAYWTLFVFSLFNPQDFFYYQLLLWILRSLIIRLKYSQDVT